MFVRGRRRRLGGVAAAVAVVLAGGCGGATEFGIDPVPTSTPITVDDTAVAEPDPTPTAGEPAPGPTPGPIEDGLVEVAQAYAFAVPDGWVQLTDPADVEELFEQGSGAVGLNPTEIPLLLSQLDVAGSIVLLGDGGDSINVLALPDFDPLGTNPEVYVNLLEAQFGGAEGVEVESFAAQHETVGDDIAGLLTEGSYLVLGERLFLTQFVFEGQNQTYSLTITLADDDDATVNLVLDSLELR